MSQFGSPPRRAIWALLVGILLFGLYLRVARIDRVNEFNGDQGEYYLGVMDWLIDGHWPLVGQKRNVTEDFTLGPGWFYTITPALALTRFHPAAGSVTVTLFSLASILLTFLWIQKTTGNGLLGLAVATIFVCSAELVEQDRTLWCPNVLPFATIAIAMLMNGFGANPARNLALYLALVMILPHWHTTGLIVVGISLPFVLWLISRNKPRLEATPRGAVLAWASFVIVIFLALYLPPLINEWRPGQGNLKAYLINSLVPTPPSSVPLTTRIGYNANLLDFLIVRHFFTREVIDVDFPRWIASVFVIGAIVAAMVISMRRKLDVSVVFLAVVFFAFWVVCVKQGEYFDVYYFRPVLGAPIQLAGWAAGCFIPIALERGHRYRPWAACVAAVLILGGLGLSLLQLPKAWKIHRQEDHAFIHTRAIVDFIAQDSGDQPFSLGLIEARNYRSHFQALLWRAGRRPLNRNQDRMAIPIGEFGQRAYVILRGKARDFAGTIEGFNGALPLAAEIGDARIYRIPRGMLPETAQELDLQCDPRARTYRIAAQPAD